MDELAAIKRDLAAVNGQIESLSAETLALQFVLSGVLNELLELNPAMLPAILKGFDAAANVAERLSIQHGKSAGHLPRTLEIIEQLRTSVKGQDKPRHGV
jgi:hypothetical protein